MIGDFVFQFFRVNFKIDFLRGEDRRQFWNFSIVCQFQDCFFFSFRKHGCSNCGGSNFEFRTKFSIEFLVVRILTLTSRAKYVRTTLNTNRRDQVHILSPGEH